MDALSPSGRMEKTAVRGARLMKRAFDALHEAHAGGRPVTIIVPVNSTGPAGPTAAIVRVCRDLDPGLGGSVIAEVFKLPARLSLDVLDAITIPSMAFFDTFVAQPQPGMDDVTVFSNCDDLGVSVDLEDRAWPPEEAKARLMAV